MLFFSCAATLNRATSQEQIDEPVLAKWALLTAVRVLVEREALSSDDFCVACHAILFNGRRKTLILDLQRN
jgi:hypothetical protein